MSKNVKLHRLIDGSEILGETIDHYDESFIKIKNPVRVVIVPTKTDPKTPTVGFAPWAEFSDEKEFRIHKAHIIVSMTPVKEFINQYNTIHGGLVLPTKSGLITP
jgi:hypothetical protein